MQHNTIESKRTNRLYNLIGQIQEHIDFGHPIFMYELIETHISYILLTGNYAYKFKKPLNLGFLDFSTLASRKFYCEEELRLNRRLAPDIYIDVIAIRGTLQKPVLGNNGTVLEYALKMIQFDRTQELDRLAKRKELTWLHINNLATSIAKFHMSAAIATTNDNFGSLDEVIMPVLDNIEQIKSCDAVSKVCENSLGEIEIWTRNQIKQLKEVFIHRKKQGYVRECHGDLHLGNIALYNNELLIFDCIEFSEQLRWIDVMSEIAFLIMDLDMLDQPQLAYQFLNTYFERNGDYSGLSLLRFYLVYRAMVRAKIACICLNQTQTSEAKHDFVKHVDLASRYIKSANPLLIITHGLSGSGKTSVSQMILQSFKCIRIRSDIERKRLFNMPSNEKTGGTTPPGQGIYTRSADIRVYEHLSKLAKIIIEAGYSVIVDATFLLAQQRSLFHKLARCNNAHFIILDIEADKAVLSSRIYNRSISNDDESEANCAVLDFQYLNREPLSEKEYDDVLKINTNNPIDKQKVINEIKARMKWLPC